MPTRRSVRFIPEGTEAPHPKTSGSSIHINIILFILTLLTTTWAGAYKGTTLWEFFLSGLPYSLTLMAMLLSHEFGHYFAARKFGVESTLPYFIPLPVPKEIFSFGTMGAVIKIKSLIPERRALLYIGSMGPIAGFIVSLAAIIYGVYVSEIKSYPAEQMRSFLQLGDPLMMKLVVMAVHGDIPAGHEIFLSPYALAGWAGCLITSINLIPIGQLDGGHVMYALLGRKQLYVGWTAFAGLGVATYFFYGWALWIIIILFFLMVAHPYVPDGQKLTLTEKIMGWSCMVIFILTFMPVPFPVAM